MRIFAYGSVMGIVSSMILARRNTTVGHPRYMSVYASRAFSLLGLLISFCLFPALVASNLYKTTSDSINPKLYSSVLRMYLSLISGVLGSFSASAITYRKIHIHDIIFSALAGGIVYSSCADIHENPVIPLMAGFTVAFYTTLFHSVNHRRINKNGVLISLASFGRYLVPAISCGILSAIVVVIKYSQDQALFQSQRKIGELFQRSKYGQGGYQLAGLGLSIAFGIGVGILLGLLFKLINRNKSQQQFNDAQIYRPDFPPSVHIVDWKQI